jgi:hypothetical protein
MAVMFLLTGQVTDLSGQSTSVVDCQDVHAEQKAQIIDVVLSKLNELYVYPDIARKMTLHVRKKQENHEYDQINTLKNFVHQLTKDLLSIFPDGHLEIQVLRESENEQRPQESEEEWWQRRIKEAQYYNFYFRKVEWLPGNIGYLDIRRFEFASISGPTAIAIMQFLAYSNALIIDLRQNPGGRDGLTQLFFSYFFEDHRVHYNTTINNSTKTNKQWWTLPYVPGRRRPNIPIYILTSRNTGSAAEEFAYSLKHLGRAVIIGEQTAGAAHTTHRHIFSELNIEIHIPDGRSIHPKTGKDWEGKGVQPDIPVSSDKAFDVAYAEALDELHKNVENEIDKFRVEWVKKGLDAKLNPVILNSDTKEEYIGTYGPRKILLKDGSLYYQRENRPGYQLIPLGDDWFKVEGLDYFRLHFIRTQTGRIIELNGVYDDGSVDKNQRDKK